MKSKTLFSSIAGIVLVTIAVIWLTLNSKNADSNPVESDLPVVTVYKSATCGCCKKWVAHMRENGFKVKANNVSNLQTYKEKAKLGAGMGSCHTAFVNGYAIEGHVPAKDVKRLLNEKPNISGLTVPAMPMGSPGMEVPGKPADAYQVISYKDGKQVGVFTDYPAGK